MERSAARQGAQAEQFFGFVELVEADQHAREFEPRYRVARGKAHRFAKVRDSQIEFQLARVKHTDEQHQPEIAFAQRERFILSEERTFLRPVAA